ncbi:hypothetical protein MKS88_004864 [Plasmodium brasilianum]|uniref:Uncharacterized protein n=2 Tax=Plasmodium (Plasmodium) TaxID=418103 RepID=A0A1A8WC62_PLAMA|nr:conserved Plasmodium protein, unknown function [Plasmodium malariae]KAI4835651.1 hypothetical protein MKS88_004864 [Plasmodium brasilianum]SBS89321.1 conserved Plasmodium protein, unknown function [Plasmodium malariae]SCP02580.1 conserved Plasmodium protein, unknown function [Plasmodium malariae]
MLILGHKIGRCVKIRKANFPKFMNFSSNIKNDIYNQYETFITIGNKNPEQVINLLNEINKEKGCDTELIKNITNHIYDFSEDFFCPQLVKVLENYVMLKYSDETLLAMVCNRIDDLVSIKSCLRTKIMINIFKQLNFHHPLVKLPLLSQLNDNINDYKNELVSIIKNISYLYVDTCTSHNIMNRVIVNYDYYDKDIFTIFEAFSRLDDYTEMFIDLMVEKVQNIEQSNRCCSLKDFLKFLSAYKRIGLNENTYLHTQFEKKINNIKLLSPSNISYILLQMVSAKYRNEHLFELLMMNIENYINSNRGETNYEKTNLFFYDLASCNERKKRSKSANCAIVKGGKAIKSENVIDKDEELRIYENTYSSICNRYILYFLPFHLLLLILLDYDNKNILMHLLTICVSDYLSLYDTSDLIKLLYAHTLLLVMIGKKDNNKSKTAKLEGNVLHIFMALQYVYKSATINDLKILHNCFLYHHNIFKNNSSKLKKLQDDLLYTECFSILPSSYSNLKFEQLEVVRCASSSYLKNVNNDSIYFYLNKNDFFSSNQYHYDNLLLNVRLKIDILKKRHSTSSLKIIYKENIIKSE